MCVFLALFVGLTEVGLPSVEKMDSLKQGAIECRKGLSVNVEAHEAVRQNWPYIGRTGIEKVVNSGKKMTGATRKTRFGAHRSIIIANFSCESVGARFGIKIEDFPLSQKKDLIPDLGSHTIVQKKSPELFVRDSWGALWDSNP